MKRASKKTAKSPARRVSRAVPSDMNAADRAVEEIRAIRRRLWKDAGGTSAGVVEIGRREGAFGSTPTRKRRKSA